MDKTKSDMLYELMLRKGYPEGFARVVSSEMRTDYLAERRLHHWQSSQKICNCIGGYSEISR